MSWTSPRTWVTDEVVSASQLNTHVRDNLLETAPAKVTTAGDTVYATGANALARLAVGSAGDRLRVNTAGTALEWDAVILDRDLDTSEVVNDASGFGHPTLAIPANELGTTGGIRFTVVGDYLNDTGIDRTLTFAVLFNATTIFSNTLTLPASANRRKWRAVVDMMNSATDAQKWGISFGISAASSEEFGVTSPTLTTDGGGTGYATSAVDTTASSTVRLQTTHSVANASLSFRQQMAILEKLPAA